MFLDKLHRRLELIFESIISWNHRWHHYGRWRGINMFFVPLNAYSHFLDSSFIRTCVLSFRISRSFRNDNTIIMLPSLALKRLILENGRTQVILLRTEQSSALPSLQKNWKSSRKGCFRKSEKMHLVGCPREEGPTTKTSIIVKNLLRSLLLKSLTCFWWWCWHVFQYIFL